MRIMMKKQGTGLVPTERTGVLMDLSSSTLLGGTTVISADGLTGTGQNQGHINYDTPTTGKYYWEVRTISGYSNQVFGLHGLSKELLPYNLGDFSGIYSISPGPFATSEPAGIWQTGTRIQFRDDGGAGIIYSFAYDADSLLLQVYRNGILIGSNIVVEPGSKIFSLYNGNTSSQAATRYNFGQDPSFDNTVTPGTYAGSDGHGLFYYPVPAGYNAILV